MVQVAAQQAGIPTADLSEIGDGKGIQILQRQQRELKLGGRRRWLGVRRRFVCSQSVTKSPEMDKVAAEIVIYAVGFLVDTLAGQSVVSRPAAKVAELKAKAEDKPASGFDQPYR